MMFKNISLESTDKVLSSHTGLIFFEAQWNQLKLDKLLRRLLPKKNKKRGLAQIDKVKGLLFSFALGNDCLEDLEELRADAIFYPACWWWITSKNCGGFSGRIS